LFLEQVYETDIYDEYLFYSSIAESNNFILKIPLSQNPVEKVKNGIEALEVLRLKSIVL
jgi:hypothetical protein